MHDEVDRLEVRDESVKALGETDDPYTNESVVRKERVELVVVRQRRAVDALLLAGFHEAYVGEADHHPDHGGHESHTRDEILERGVCRCRDRSKGEHRKAQSGEDCNIRRSPLVGNGKDLRQVAVLSSACGQDRRDLP